MNNTDINGMFTVYDGVKDKSILNHIDTWKGQKNLSFWFTPEANMMNGTGKLKETTQNFTSVGLLAFIRS